jgi:hypothetical protein
MNTSYDPYIAQRIQAIWETYLGIPMQLRRQMLDVADTVPFERLARMIVVGTGVDIDRMRKLIVADNNGQTKGGGIFVESLSGEQAHQGRAGQYVMNTLSRKLSGLQKMVEDESAYDMRYLTFILASLYPARDVLALNPGAFTKALLIASIVPGEVSWHSMRELLAADIDVEIASTFLVGEVL